LFERANEKELAQETIQVDDTRAEVYRQIDAFKKAVAIDLVAMDEQAKGTYKAFGQDLKDNNVTGDAYTKARRVARELRKAFQDALESKDQAVICEAMDNILAHQQDDMFKDTSFETLFEMARVFKETAGKIDLDKSHVYLEELAQVEEILAEMLGPRPGEPVHPLIRLRYGATRWDQAQACLQRFNTITVWEAGPRKPGELEDPNEVRPLVAVAYPRKARFAGTELEGVFVYVNEHMQNMLNPRLTVYWQYFIDDSYNSHYFGGVGPEILGTLMVTLLSILFVVPFGVIAAAYLVECAGDNWTVRIIRMCINTLAGVPSIVFGLFGVAFFIMFLLPVIGMDSKACILAASLTLAVLTLPVMIRASEEAIRAVPRSYKEGSLALGASGFRTFMTVTLPSALPGILTGVILSLSRVAGETAPVLFTGAVSMGSIPKSIFDPTRTLSYGSYDMAVGDRVAMMVPHNQYGMVVTLVGLILCLNAVAVLLRGRVFKKLKGY
jgi:phosphate transport system permease protein